MVPSLGINGFVAATVEPGHIGRLDAVVVLEKPADPQSGGHLEFWRSHLLSVEILRPADTGVTVHEHPGVSEYPRQEDGDTDQAFITLAEHQHVGR